MTILAAAVVLLSLVYLGIVLHLCGGLFKLTPSGTSQGLSYSVVIAAHNEEDIIGECLESVLAQGFPQERYEVIVVNDRSTDTTRDVAESFCARHSNLTIVGIDRTPPGVSPKKHAVSVGIEKAMNDAVVLTDADCLVPTTWLSTIDKNWSGDAGLVQGITAYRKPEGMNSLFFGLQAVDFLSHGIVSAAAIGAGLPLNSNANNMAFLKSAFEDVGGYGDNAGVISGDDDLLLQRIAGSGRWSIEFMTDPAGMVLTRPTATLRGIMEQRKRWASKTVHYNTGQILQLTPIFAFYTSILASILVGFFDSTFFLAAVVMLAVKIFGELILMIPGTSLFCQPALRPYILPASLVQLLVVPLSVVGGVFGTFTWKGQALRRRAAG